MNAKDWIDLIEATTKVAFLVALLILGVPFLKRYRLKSVEVLGLKFELLERELREAEKARGTADIARPRDGLDLIHGRAMRIADRLRETQVLWIDNNDPVANLHERRALGGLGVNIDMVRTTSEAADLLARAPYDVLITNYSRPDDQGGAQLLCKKSRPPVIFYAGEPRQTPDGAFGYTLRPAELLHLVMDAVERTRPASENAPN